MKNSGTKAQNHIISDQIWKEPLDVICSNLPTKARSLTSIGQDHIQVVFEHLKGWRLLNCPGQTVPVLGHPHRRKAFFRGNLLSFSFCSLSPVPFTAPTIPAFLFHLGHLSWRYELACLVLWHIPRHLHVIQYEIMF